MRSQIRVPFGAGLDRATGVTSRSPESFVDLRNVDLVAGRALARRGHALRTSFSLGGAGVTPMTDIVLVDVLRAVGQGIACAYEAASRVVQLFTTASTGLNPVYRAQWATLAADAEVPSVFGAESYRKYFLAHDQGVMASRMVTRYYDADAATLTTLQANLDGAGAADVKFRGVVRHLSYLLGWGFGTAAEADRPEVIRASLPGQPTVFHPEHYWLAGARGEPVLNVVPHRDMALAFKRTETYALVGYSRDNFGIRPLDPRYGLAGSHLACEVNGATFFWSLEGPRVIEGGESVDLSLPLRLDGELPADLVEAAGTEGGFAYYVPPKQRIEFRFGYRTYTLHLAEPGRPKWSYSEYGVLARCAGTFFSGTSTSVAPTGHPEVSITDMTASTMALAITHVGAVGDETLEVWLRVGAGAYVRVRDQLIANVTSQTMELTALDGVTPGTITHYVAVRYRRGLAYTAGYGSTDPGAWPAASRDSDVTDANAGAPSAITLDDVNLITVKGNSYVEQNWSWTQGESAVGARFQLWYCDTADPLDRSMILLFETDADPTGYVDYVGAWLQGAPRFKYFFGRHVLADGTPSVWVAYAGNPLDVGAGL